MLGPSLAPLCVLAASTARSALAIPLGSSLELNQVTLEVPSEIAEQRWLAPHEIQGNSWLSKYDKQRVDVEGVVTARSCVSLDQSLSHRSPQPSPQADDGISPASLLVGLQAVRLLHPVGRV